MYGSNPNTYNEPTNFSRSKPASTAQTTWDNDPNAYRTPLADISHETKNHYSNYKYTANYENPPPRAAQPQNNRISTAIGGDFTPDWLDHDVNRVDLRLKQLYQRSLSLEDQAQGLIQAISRYKQQMAVALEEFGRVRMSLLESRVHMDGPHVDSVSRFEDLSTTTAATDQQEYGSTMVSSFAGLVGPGNVQTSKIGSSFQVFNDTTEPISSIPSTSRGNIYKSNQKSTPGAVDPPGPQGKTAEAKDAIKPEDQSTNMNYNFSNQPSLTEDTVVALSSTGIRQPSAVEMKWPREVHTVPELLVHWFIETPGGSLSISKRDEVYKHLWRIGVDTRSAYYRRKNIITLIEELTKKESFKDLDLFEVGECVEYFRKDRQLSLVQLCKSITRNKNSIISEIESIRGNFPVKKL